MNKWQAINQFWNSFGVPAYDENSVPDDAVMPYITYNVSIGDFDAPVSMYASVWYKSMLWRDISLKVDEISERITPYKLIPLDNHEYVYITKGSPFAQRMTDSDTVKRVYVNITAEFFINH